ncbi:MAG: UdgX family uracil-DNA binding protein [Myxococcota bacterium]
MSPRSVRLGIDFAEWRAQVRALLEQQVPPRNVLFVDDCAPQRSLFEVGCPPVRASRSRRPRSVPRSGPLSIPRRYLEVARRVIHHRNSERFALLYRIAWRITQGDRGLLGRASDTDIMRLRALDAEVRRDMHKMKAFVRFRRVSGKARRCKAGSNSLDKEEHENEYVAWYRSDHRVVPLVADFFADRFRGMRWMILTPDASVRWDGRDLSYGPGAERDEARRCTPQGDELEELWRSYYRSIFNPARLKLRAMQAEMPRKFWSTLPEAEIIDGLIREAPLRVQKMLKSKSVTAKVYVPSGAGIEQLRTAVTLCEACPLCSRAGGAVFGEGPRNAVLMLVGEQPGDVEDQQGRPFVGPAGAELDRALAAAGIDRNHVYITNAVKAFKYELKGERRLHKRANASEVEKCKPWLGAEIEALRPRVVVALGATAGLALAGRTVSVSRDGGRLRLGWSAEGWLTYHPAALLRAPNPRTQDERFQHLVKTLRESRRGAG